MINLNEIKLKLSSSVSDKEEKLRKLKMVQMYRKKNDLSKLEVLIQKWRNVSQEAIRDLRQMLPEPKPSLHDLIQHLQIDIKLLKYNSESDDFD
ncbi:hypothetical protein LOTGIDRAFT_115232 [Lottia gigantea]|uniref:Swi5-dependent recombination DNA repair protein 1 homolog n=1 Tax=Lottia gigantea TaxID=225164 RepID=V4AIL9_LOTGI|nr:hypothetical protein LOTGIDRAFT_115232 [Lottia gigantea]ESO96827.1 hypothetical protein LOTGIDRAFT_115232 [Lottia gigantea]